MGGMQPPGTADTTSSLYSCSTVGSQGTTSSGRRRHNHERAVRPSIYHAIQDQLFPGAPEEPFCSDHPRGSSEEGSHSGGRGKSGNGSQTARFSENNNGSFNIYGSGSPTRVPGAPGEPVAQLIPTNRSYFNKPMFPTVPVPR